MDHAPLQVFEDLIRDWCHESINTILVGVVHAYNPATQRADIQPLIMNRRRDESTDALDERMPIIPSVPVCFYGTAAFEAVMDVVPGDRLLILCCKDSIDSLLSQDTESPGSFQRKFHLSNAVALPMAPRALSNPRVACPAGTMRIGAADGPQTTYGLDGTMTQTALSEIDIAGQGGVKIHSDCDVTVQERNVDPIGGDI